MVAKEGTRIFVGKLAFPSSGIGEQRGTPGQERHEQRPLAIVKYLSIKDKTLITFKRKNRSKTQSRGSFLK